MNDYTTSWVKRLPELKQVCENFNFEIETTEVLQNGNLLCGWTAKIVTKCHQSKFDAVEDLQNFAKQLLNN